MITHTETNFFFISHLVQRTTLNMLPNCYTMFDIAQMVYQHKIQGKEVFTWYSIFNIYKLLKLFQNYNPYH